MRLLTFFLLSAIALPAQAQLCTLLPGMDDSGDGTGNICHVTYATSVSHGVVPSVYGAYTLQQSQAGSLTFGIDISELSSVGVEKVTLLELGFTEALGPEHGGVTLALQSSGSPDAGWTLYWTVYDGMDHAGSVPSGTPFAWIPSGNAIVNVGTKGGDWCRPLLSISGSSWSGKPVTVQLGSLLACAPVQLRSGIMGASLAPGQIAVYEFAEALISP